MKTIEILGKTYPANLALLIKHGKQEDFEIKSVYDLELTHDLMGYFPAKVTEVDTTEIIYTAKFSILEIVWGMLSPRDSHFNIGNWYVSRDGTVGYFIGHRRGDEYSEPLRLLNQDRFDELQKKDNVSFKWASGLIGNDMSREDFIETIKSAVNHV